jgi:hypothetical protein
VTPQPTFTYTTLVLRIQNAQFGAALLTMQGNQTAAPNGGYARASYASGGGGASRMPQIAGDATTADSALVGCVLVSYAPCAERRRF